MECLLACEGHLYCIDLLLLTSSLGFKYGPLPFGYEREGQGLWIWVTNDIIILPFLRVVKKKTGF